jgi:hypothetical protein
LATHALNGAISRDGGWVDMYLECGKNSFTILLVNVLKTADKQAGRNFRDM